MFEKRNCKLSAIKTRFVLCDRERVITLDCSDSLVFSKPAFLESIPSSEIEYAIYQKLFFTGVEVMVEFMTQFIVGKF